MNKKKVDLQLLLLCNGESLIHETKYQYFNKCGNKRLEMALVPLSPVGGDALRRRVPQSAISGDMFLKMKTDPAFYGRTRASTTGGTVPIPVVMHSPEPVPTAGHHFPLDTQPGRLPLLHDSFQPKSKVGAGRSFTMFALITCGTKDAPENEIPTRKNRYKEVNSWMEIAWIGTWTSRTSTSKVISEKHARSEHKVCWCIQKQTEMKRFWC